MMHRYSPANSFSALAMKSLLVTLPSGFLVSMETGNPVLETSAVVPQMNDKGSTPLAVHVRSMASPASTVELLGWSIMVRSLDAVTNHGNNN